MKPTNKPLYIIAATVGIVFFIGLNAMVYKIAKNNSKQSDKATVTQGPDAGVTIFPTHSPAPTELLIPTTTPVPSPTIALGPGNFACDINGKCNYYENPSSSNCPATFADRNCLDSCSDETKRCEL